MTTANQNDGPVFVATWDFGELAVREAWTHWQRHHDLHGACLAGTAAVELDPTIPTVGIGGLPNRDGQVELDAATMRGSDLACGSVAALRSYCPAVAVAKAVMDQGSHVMLAGQGADVFAAERGLGPPEGMLPEELLTETTRSEYAQWRADVASGKADEEKMVGHDTVCVLGYHAGQTVACVATSGLGFKRPGRVGDSPIIGGGLYADDQAGCCASTGIGEELYRHAVSIRAVDAMRSGMHASEATAGVLRAMIERDGANARRGLSIMAIDKAGQVGAATTRTDNHRFEYHVCRGGVFERVEPVPVGG